MHDYVIIPVSLAESDKRCKLQRLSVCLSVRDTDFWLEAFSSVIFELVYLQSHGGRQHNSIN